MKKFVILLSIIILNVGNAFADVDLSEQAKLLYADNNIAATFDLLLSIPEDDRTAENWLLLGNILQDKGRTSDALLCIIRQSQKIPNIIKLTTISQTSI